jgi:hypothetical protein
MKFSNVLKVFGAAALVAGLTPYRITRDEETGEKKYRALFWEATTGPQAEGEEKDLSVHLGFFSPTEKDDEEPHFFADELTVEYTKEDIEGGEATEEAEQEAVVEPAEAEPAAAEAAASEEIAEETDQETAE